MTFFRNPNSAPFLLLLPAAVVIVAVVLIPLLVSFYSSFTAYNLTHPETLFRWIGARNYERLAESPDFWWALLRTVAFLTIALNLELLLGLGLALLVNRITAGQRLLRTVIMFPMMFSPVLVGFQFSFMFNDNVGLIDNLLVSLGFIDQPIPWLVGTVTANLTIILAEIWMSSSVFAVLLLAGLFAMPRDPLEAARVDGCNSWQSLRYVTLPFLMPFIYVAMTIRSLDVGRAYDMVRIMTNGGPAGRTDLLWTQMSTVGYQDAHMGIANAMGYVSIILSVGFTFYFYTRLVAARDYMGSPA